MTRVREICFQRIGPSKNAKATHRRGNGGCRGSAWHITRGRHGRRITRCRSRNPGRVGVSASTSRPLLPRLECHRRAARLLRQLRDHGLHSAEAFAHEPALGRGRRGIRKFLADTFGTTRGAADAYRVAGRREKAPHFAPLAFPAAAGPLPRLPPLGLRFRGFAGLHFGWQNSSPEKRQAGAKVSAEEIQPCPTPGRDYNKGSFEGIEGMTGNPSGGNLACSLGRRLESRTRFPSAERRSKCRHGSVDQSASSRRGCLFPRPPPTCLWSYCSGT